MIAKDLLEVEISQLQHTDTAEIALHWMDEFKVSHLPVLKNDNFVGLISESDILDRMDLDQTLDVLFEDAHIYEILQKISEHKISVVPILTKEEKYVGCTTVHQVVAMIGNTGGIKEHGAILVLEVNQIDYSLAQIAQIVESNNAKILSSYIMSSPDSTKLEVTLKINKTELDPIIRTFERYDYTISASFQKSDFNDDLQLRYDSLINYLKL